jgi:hypothetical protein
MIVHTPARPRRLGIPGLLHADPLASALGRRLDDGNHWFGAIALGSGDPIGAVAVGPGGTWCITRASERGRFARRNGHWYRWNGSTESWVPWEAEIVATARMGGHRLSLHLERAGAPAEVTAVLFTPSGVSVQPDRGERLQIEIVADGDGLARRMNQEDRLTPQQVDRIVALLDPRQPLPQLVQATPRG